jgi:hypothetical protein
MAETNPYSPYAGLAELVDAAGVPVSSINSYPTEQLLRLARERQTKALAPDTSARRDKPAWATRSIRILDSLERAVDAKARREGTNLNAVVGRLLKEYVDGPSSR